MHEWNDFFVAVAGASAALAGLIFVGVSINLNKILAHPALPNRALTSMILLLSILVVSVLLLVPVKTLYLIGYITSAFGLAIWIIITKLDFQSLRLTDKKYKTRYYLGILFNQLAVLPYIIGGLLILSNGKTGLYWIATAIIISFIKSVSEAWVLLVEINR